MQDIFKNIIFIFCLVFFFCWVVYHMHKSGNKCYCSALQRYCYYARLSITVLIFRSYRHHRGDLKVFGWFNFKSVSSLSSTSNNDCGIIVCCLKKKKPKKHLKVESVQKKIIEKEHARESEYEYVLSCARPPRPYLSITRTRFFFSCRFLFYIFASSYTFVCCLMV